MSSPGISRHSALRALPAATATLAGIVAALAAAAYDYVVGLEIGSPSRDLMGPLGRVSIVGAFAAIALALVGVVMAERRARRLAAAVVGAALGALTLAYWAWVLEGVLDTT